MNSTDFQSIARAADYDLGRTIIAMVEIPPSPGTFPAAWVVASRSDLDSPGQFVEAHAEFDYSIHRAIFGDRETANGTNVWFDSGDYDRTYPSAMERFAVLTATVVRESC